MEKNVAEGLLRGTNCIFVKKMTCRTIAKTIAELLPNCCRTIAGTIAETIAGLLPVLAGHPLEGDVRLPP